MFPKLHVKPLSRIPNGPGLPTLPTFWLVVRSFVFQTFGIIFLATYQYFLSHIDRNDDFVVVTAYNEYRTQENIFKSEKSKL